MAEVAELINGVAPLYEQSIYDAIVAGWVDGAADALPFIPTEATSVPIPAGLNPPPPDTPSGTSLLWPGDEEPVVRLASIDNAVERLLSRNVVQADDFYALSASARRQAFTITGDLADSTLERIRDRLADVVREGPNLKAFRTALVDEFDSLPIGAAHLEQVFRNNVNESFSQGMETILDHPAVDDGFPYRLYIPVHDARARREHRALETMGIDGTAVYYKDDPTWLRFRPPWSWGCRCGWSAISVETAASLGVREAQEWLRTGVEPVHPAVPRPPFDPPPGWERTTAEAMA